MDPSIYIRKNMSRYMRLADARSRSGSLALPFAGATHPCVGRMSWLSIIYIYTGMSLVPLCNTICTVPPGLRRTSCLSSRPGSRGG
jgi:hypothetical protein